MKKEKKLKANQKLALERIYRLFELAEEMNKKKKDKYVKKYLTLAKRLSEKCKVSIPKELKMKFCRKCLLMDVSAENEEYFLTIVCNKCNAVKRYSSAEAKH